MFAGRPRNRVSRLIRAPESASKCKHGMRSQSIALKYYPPRGSSAYFGANRGCWWRARYWRGSAMAQRRGSGLPEKFWQVSARRRSDWRRRSAYAVFDWCRLNLMGRVICHIVLRELPADGPLIGRIGQWRAVGFEFAPSHIARMRC